VGEKIASSALSWDYADSRQQAADLVGRQPEPGQHTTVTEPSPPHPGLQRSIVMGGNEWTWPLWTWREGHWCFSPTPPRAGGTVQGLVYAGQVLGHWATLSAQYWCSYLRVLIASQVGGSALLLQGVLSKWDFSQCPSQGPPEDKILQTSFSFHYRKACTINQQDKPSRGQRRERPAQWQLEAGWWRAGAVTPVSSSETVSTKSL
jgi:hypothetical protein